MPREDAAPYQVATMKLDPNIILTISACRSFRQAAASGGTSIQLGSDGRSDAHIAKVSFIVHSD